MGIGILFGGILLMILTMLKLGIGLAMTKIKFQILDQPNQVQPMLLFMRIQFGILATISCSISSGLNMKAAINV